MQNKKLILIQYKGANIFAYSKRELKDKIKKYDYERSIFFKSSVYTYSCYARLLNNNKVELIEYFNNGETKKITKFNNQSDFYKSKENN